MRAVAVQDVLLELPFFNNIHCLPGLELIRAGFSDILIVSTCRE